MMSTENVFDADVQRQNDRNTIVQLNDDNERLQLALTQAEQKLLQLQASQGRYEEAITHLQEQVRSLTSQLQQALSINQ